jgi:2-keto-4-pentenoate hydratase/2-oxohepta-3-ene-1,7-dioic acid hydratase in catechol pathway
MPTVPMPTVPMPTVPTVPTVAVPTATMRSSQPRPAFSQLRCRFMRICRFTADSGPHLGVVRGDEIVDITGSDPNLPTDPSSLLATDGIDAVTRAARHAARIPLARVRLLPPIPRPPKFLAIGLNYADHVQETGRDPQTFQLWFNKQSTCVIGPHEAIQVPRVSDKVDYEGELGVVIARRARHVPVRAARDVIAGFVVVNDVSVRDWQRRSPTMTMGKSFDTHGPIGPWIITADEIDDPHALQLQTWVNDELRQDASTEQMIFNAFEQIEHLSTAFTLEPGDVISTGTPAGVGVAMQPPQYLRAGDRVRITIEGVGTLENPVIDEPADLASSTEP